MKLFILNKSAMDDDLHDAKRVHKLAFNELKYSVEIDETIPINLIIEDRHRNYFFALKKCDIEKEIYQYEYLTLIIG